MKKIDRKKKILETGITKHHSVVDDFKRRIRDLRDSEVIIDEDEFDHQTQAQNEQANSQISRIADQLNFANDELETLYRIRIEAPLHKEVTFGTVVVTDMRTFFISTSIEKFHVGRKEYFGISTKAPIYAEMKGKKKGDSFEFKGIKYHIQDLF